MYQRTCTQHRLEVAACENIPPRQENFHTTQSKSKPLCLGKITLCEEVRNPKDLLSVSKATCKARDYGKASQQHPSAEADKQVVVEPFRCTWRSPA